MTVEEIKKALVGGFQQMNTSKTEREPYEYDRNSDLIGRPYETGEELQRQVEGLRQLAPGQRQDEWASGALVVLILIFTGVVLWEVWR